MRLKPLARCTKLARADRGSGGIHRLAQIVRDKSVGEPAKAGLVEAARDFSRRELREEA